MHEASVITDLIRKVVDVAQSQQARRVTRVHVTLGAWSHIAPEHLRAHFAYASQGTLAEGARLEIDVRPETDTARAQEVRLDQIEVEA